MIITKELERELDAIDWERPNDGLPFDQQYRHKSQEEDANLHEFIVEMAELIPDVQAWKRFTAAFHQYSNTGNGGLCGRR